MFGLFACAPAEREATGAFDRAQVERSVRERMISYASALEALDSARILAHYVAGSEFRLVIDGASNSYEDMLRIIGNLPRALRKEEVHWDTLVVTALGPDAGLVYAPFRRVDTDTTGRVVRIRGVATWLWVRRDGQWHSVYGHADHYPDTASSE
jgi:ketosteroid isomerase-like protein